jgi:hypothetical protein
MNQSAKWCPLGIALTLFMCQVPARADHLPEELLASGKPEIALAGINLKTTKFKDVIRMYGQPTRKKQVGNDASWTGYIWELPGAKLEVGVIQDKAGPKIYDIYVEGTARGKVGSTGRGLKFGDSIKTIKSIYGSRFELSNLGKESPKEREEFTGVTVANKRVTMQWKKEDFTLTVGLDNAGRVSAMWLILPECYGGCE